MAESEKSFTWTKSVARWSREGRAAYEAVLFNSFFFSGARGANQAEKNVYEGGGNFVYSFRNFGLIFIVLRCCCAMLFFLFRTYCSYCKEKRYSTWGMYVRTACEPAYVTSELFIRGARVVFSWNMAAGLLALSSRATTTINIYIYIQPWTSVRFAYFDTLSPS